MRVLTAREAAALIHDDATVSVSGCTYRMVPEEFLAAVEDRFVGTGAPRGLTLFFPIMTEKARAGVGGAGTGLNRFGHQGMVRRLIGGSYGRSAESELNALVYEDAVEAYNLPMGTMFQLLRCAASRQPGLLTATGIGTYVDPREQGGRLNARTTENLAEVLSVRGRELLFYPTIPIDVACIRGTTADARGNISLEDEAFSMGVLYHAMAARSNGGVVIVQVQRLAEYGAIPAKAVRIPACLVDAVVLDDPARHNYLDENAPTLSGRLRQPVELAFPELNVRTIVSRRALAEMAPGMVVNLGAGLGMYDLPMVAVALGRARDLNFTLEQGPLGGVPGPGGIARNPDAYLDSLEVFDFYDGGGIDVACLSYGQVDREGNVNVSRFGRNMVGSGGFINITEGARKVLFCGTLTTKGLDVECGDGRLRITREGAIKRFVACVEHKTFSARHSPLDRQEVLYITERCVFKLTAAGPELVEIAPGVDIQRDIRNQVAFEVRVSNSVKTMDPELFRGDSRYAGILIHPDRPGLGGPGSASGSMEEASRMRRAGLMGPRRFELHEVDVPTPGPTQVLVKVAYNGVCGSEFPAYLGLCTGYPYYARKQAYPILSYGHEGAGHIVAIGSQVQDFKVGDRVVGSGGYAEYVVAEAGTLTAVPDGISDRHAALCKMAQEAAFVLELIRVTTADRVLITGVGPAGLLILEHLREAGCADIACVDAVERRLEVAASLGATAVLKAGDGNLVEKIRAACGGGPTIAIDTSGVTQAILTCYAAVANHGQLGLFGRPLDDIPSFRVEDIVHRFLRVIGLKCPAIAYSRDRTLATLLRIKRGVLHADAIITHEYPLERVGEAFEAAVSREGLKVVVKCG